MISINELNQILSREYILKCFVDLEQLTNAPNVAYKNFQMHYQEVFDNNDRLVLYTTQPISNMLLQHLYQATGLIDISNFFVLICSPNNIKPQVESVASSYFSDRTAFQTLQIEFEETKKLQNNFVLSDTLCPMPWTHLEISAQGEIKPCCVYRNNVGNIKNSSLHDTFYSHNVSNLRQQLLSGNKPTGCSKCWELESRGLVSNRNYHMSFLKKDLLTTYIDQPKIKSLDIKPGNTCNFKCRICNPKSSSLFEQEYAKSNQLSVRSFNWTEDSNAFDEITDLLPSLTNIDMYGGEPFLIKHLTKLVEQSVTSGHASNIRLHYNSNGSIYPTALIEHWKHFKHIDIQFSIDNIGQRFEIERGGSWESIDSNIRKLVDLNLPNVSISIMPAISIMNIFYLDELLDWANNLGLLVNPLYVTTPPGFDLKDLTVDARKLILDKFHTHPHPVVQDILNYIRTSPESDGKKFRQICKHFDMLRNQHFSDSHPEIAHVMGYNK